MNVQRAAEGFLFHKEADGMAPNTIAGYRRTLDEFAAFCPDLDLTDVTADRSFPINAVNYAGFKFRDLRIRATNSLIDNTCFRSVNSYNRFA